MSTLIFHILLYLLPNQLHPLYLSNTAIRYQEEEKRIYLRFQIFEEDLDAILQIGHGISMQSSNAKLQEYINAYIMENFTLWVDGKKRASTEFVFLKRSKQYDSIILEYEIKNVNVSPRKMAAEATFLMELFPDQTNIVAFTIGKKKKSFPLKEYNTKAEFSID